MANKGATQVKRGASKRRFYRWHITAVELKVQTSNSSASKLPFSSYKGSFPAVVTLSNGEPFERVDMQPFCLNSHIPRESSSLVCIMLLPVPLLMDPLGIVSARLLSSHLTHQGALSFLQYGCNKIPSDEESISMEQWKSTWDLHKTWPSTTGWSAHSEAIQGGFGLNRESHIEQKLNVTYTKDPPSPHTPVRKFLPISKLTCRKWSHASILYFLYLIYFGKAQQVDAKLVVCSGMGGAWLFLEILFSFLK